jgi:hypothetical protein
MRNKKAECRSQQRITEQRDDKDFIDATFGFTLGAFDTGNSTRKHFVSNSNAVFSIGNDGVLV